MRCLVRPEAIRLLQADEHADNEWDATVKDVMLAGGVTRYAFVGPGGMEMRTTVLSGGPAARHAVGAAVRIGFDRADARALPDKDAA